MSVKVRFAPSPTGRLHVGNIYVALHNWLFAKKRGGRFLLRLDDTDRERSTAAFAEAIRTDLDWLGLRWDEAIAQSERIRDYDRAAEILKEKGRLYPCFETAEELALKRKIALGQGRPPIYDRAALALSKAEIANHLGSGRKPHWRFRLEARRVEWVDLVRGPQHIEESSQSDPILIREDGTYLYTLPSVVDDVETGVTHVIRGNDHVTNTATQIQIFLALGHPAPTFAHLPLLIDAAGEGLSKRTGALSIGELRESGLEPLAIAAYLAEIGAGDIAELPQRIEDLLAQHDLGRFGRNSPRFDPQELLALNARLLHRLPYAAILARLEAAGLGAIDAEVWQIAHANIEKLTDIAHWQKIARGAVTPDRADPDFCEKAAAMMPAAPWSEETWKEWTEALGRATGRKGRALFHPLRAALTGQDRGPEMKWLLPLIGRDRAIRRLRGETA